MRFPARGLRHVGRALAYPAVTAGALVIYGALTASAVPAATAGYAAAAAGAGAVVILERWIPHRKSWRPTRRDLVTDLVYLAAVQTALPVALGLTLATVAVRAVDEAGIAATGLWPHGWPVAAQVVLLLLAADLLRYGLHVAAHRVGIVWRLHAVHHSSAKLYALNVGRFHPVERTFLYVLASLPFVLLGVGPAVLAPYFVLYSVNGFFQHSNVDLRLGPLNYVVSGPELHRWHHSRRPDESNRNYGVNLIVWDLVFGTYLLPRDERPGRVGVADPSYPTGFLGQLAAPFFRRPGAAGEGGAPPEPAARDGGDAWSRARALAARTPASRNRYVDFLRAASILVVVYGHWLMAAPAAEGGFTLSDLLAVAPWSRWLTWAFQVMPLFFIVGGYSNAASWDAARRSGQGYAAWLAGRLQRLVPPLLPLIVLWAAIELVARRAGLRAETSTMISQALVPTWFLSVYVMVVAVAPAMFRLWRRWGMTSFWTLVVGAALTDVVASTGSHAEVRWLNYGFVWLAVHHLGYLWWDGWLRGASALRWALGGLGMLLVLVTACDYPVSMISVPGEAASNSRPPTLALLALGALHAGLLVPLEAPVRRWLRRDRPWTATVLVSGSIMTLFLWHVTAMLLVVGLARLLGGIGLDLAPDSAAWWLTRPLWIALLSLVLLALVALFGRSERRARERSVRPPSAWQSLAGAIATCAGLAVLALEGMGEAPGPVGVRVGAVLLTVAGIALVQGRLVPSRAPA